MQEAKKAAYLYATKFHSRYQQHKPKNGKHWPEQILQAIKTKTR
jgi:hypothetical protein